MVRNLLCGLILAALPVSLAASDTGATAMLYVKGTAWLNGGAAPHSSALFPGDMVQTQQDSAATINAPGSNVLLSTDSLVKLEDKGVLLEHGALVVATSKGMTIRAGLVTVTPASAGLTQFEVADVDGAVRIIARKGDVSVSGQSGTTTVAQGQQTTVEENPNPDQDKRRRRRGAAAPVGGRGGLLNSPFAVWSGVIGVGALTTWVLIQGDEPPSPWKP